MSRSGYYFWRERSLSPKSQKKDFLDTAIQAEFKKSQRTYGSRRVYHALKAQGISCCLNTVASRMRFLGLGVSTKKKFSIQTTNSNHKDPIAPRVFKSEEPLPKGVNEVWGGDITYLQVGSCFYYLSIVLDLFNREVIGWSVDSTLCSEGVVNALKHAIFTQNTDTPIIFHSDRGCQYASKRFRSLLSQKEFIPSMSRKGNSYDNAYVESFFKTLKSDLRNMDILLTEENVVSEIFKYIEIWYNRKRRHSSLGYMTPVEFRSKNLPSESVKWPGSWPKLDAQALAIHQPGWAVDFSS